MKEKIHAYGKKKIHAYEKQNHAYGISTIPECRCFADGPTVLSRRQTTPS